MPKRDTSILFDQLKKAVKTYSGTGSTEYQLIVADEKIAYISKHLQSNKKDFSAKRGLQKLVSTRKRLLDYLLKRDPHSYDQLTKALDIRGIKGKPSEEDRKEATSVYLWHQKDLSGYDMIDMSYELWSWSQQELRPEESKMLMIRISEGVTKDYDTVFENLSGIKIESSIGKIYYASVNQMAFNQLVSSGKIAKAREIAPIDGFTSEDLSCDTLEEISTGFSEEEIENILEEENLSPIYEIQKLIRKDSKGCCVIIIDEGFDLNKPFYQDSLDLVYKVNSVNEVSRADRNFSYGSGDHGDRVAEIIHTFAPNSRFCLLQMRYSDQVDIIKVFSAIKSEIIVWAKSRPVLINISFGTNLGLHDGTHDLEDGIHQLINDVPRSYAIKSVGNEGNYNIHSTLDFTYDKTIKYLEFTIRGGNILSKKETLFITHLNNPIKYELSWGDNSIEYYDKDKIRWKPIESRIDESSVHFMRKVNSGMTELMITFEDLDRLQGNILFRLKFINIANNSGKKDLRHPFQVRAWVGKTRSRSLTFETFHRNGTITIPGTSDKIITVTAGNRTIVPDYCSRGPTYNNYQLQKPDLTIFGFSYHQRILKLGTSFASPRIVGCCAILFEILQPFWANEKLLMSEDELIEFLIKSCSNNGQWNEVNGYGFFDYSAFNQSVRQLLNQQSNGVE
jgi:small subunit ribosomal protein S15